MYKGQAGHYSTPDLNADNFKPRAMTANKSNRIAIPHHLAQNLEY